MFRKFKTKTVNCPDKKRDVEVGYFIKGSWFSPEYEIATCPAMNDGAVSCHKSCKTQLMLGSTRL